MLPSSEEYEISVEQLSELRDDPEAPSFRLIDCREDDEFSFCKIDGAELRPLSNFAEQATNFLLTDEETPMVVYCHHGMRSMQATLFLRNKGKKNVWSLAGGIDQWSEKIDESVPRY